MKTYPYRFHIALDGNGINGFEGMAGVCLFLFDPADNSYAYKIKYYDGLAAGHAVNVNPACTHGFLGNSAQHLMLYDANTLEELDRISTLQFETNDTTIRGSTHIVWEDDRHFITAIGDYFYRFSLDQLSKGERLGPHKVKLPHAIKLSSSKRYICYGSMDNPRYGRRGEAKEAGILDLRTGEATRIELPTTCWHVVAHRTKDLFYCASFRVVPQDYVDYQDWAMAFMKEYAFEIDPESKCVIRHWACGRETPAHINSDMTISDRELIFCNGGSQSIILIDLESFAAYRMIDEKPDLTTTLLNARQVATQVYDIFTRGGAFTNTRHILGALRVSRFSLIDSVYACQLSQDQSLLFTANRGLNHITIYDYPSLTTRLRVKMPDLQEYVPALPPLADPRLGFHHSYLISPAAPPHTRP
ncbi:MAG: hypothetical protein A2V62_06925 [Nitrospirae bacterium RBG_19FT_COMBO_58_9]|nr:MAG: hypothetical protein A2V62_06925 [Nitrospirae bacterium RBG_19FT_COMBO_58_9]